MGLSGRVLFVSAAVVVLLFQGCLLAEGIGNYATVSKDTAMEIADNAHCLSQAAYSVKADIQYVSELIVPHL